MDEQPATGTHPMRTFSPSKKPPIVPGACLKTYAVLVMVIMIMVAVAIAIVVVIPVATLVPLVIATVPPAVIFVPAALSFGIQVAAAFGNFSAVLSVLTNFFIQASL